MSKPRSLSLHPLPGRVLAGLALALLATFPSCATVMGTATGALTGAVDAPRAVYRIDPQGVDRSPELWLPIIAIFTPLGIALGPLMGMAKGVAIDVQAGIQNRYSYGEAFGGYGTHSVWRPYTFSEVVR